MTDRSHALRGNASTDALRSALWDAERPWLHSHAEREERSSQPPRPDRSHALRGNASTDALRSALWDAERPWLHSHAEREERSSQPPRPDRSHALRGNASTDALRSALWDAERPWLHSHAEREERSSQPPRPDRSHALRGNDRNVKAYMTCQPPPNALYNATLACTRANRNCTFMSWAAKRVRWVSSTVSRSSAPAW